MHEDALVIQASVQYAGDKRNEESMETQILPDWASALGPGGGRSQDQQFNDVIAAFANYNARRPQPTWEEIREGREAARRASPLHQKAMERRRKRKRGGPK